MAQQRHIFEVEMPDGSILEIDAPKNTPPEQIKARAAQHWKAGTKSGSAATVAAQRRKFPTVQKSGVDPDRDRSAGDVFIDQMSAAGQGVKSLPGMMMGAAKEGGAALVEMLTGRGSGRALGMAEGAVRGVVDPAVTLGRQAVEVGAQAMPGAVQRRMVDPLGMRRNVPSPEDPRTAEMASTAGANLAATTAVPVAQMAAQAALGAVPSTSKAGQVFETIKQQGKTRPVNVPPEAMDALARADELARAGGGRPTVLTRATQRIKGPSGKGNPPLTYPESFDMASAAKRLSRAEKTAMAPAMQAQLDRFAKGLQTANREFAESIGMGKQFDAAMAEYSRAMKIANTAAGAKEIAKKYGVNALIGGGLLYAISQKFFK